MAHYAYKMQNVVGEDNAMCNAVLLIVYTTLLS